MPPTPGTCPLLPRDSAARRARARHRSQPPRLPAARGFAPYVPVQPDVPVQPAPATAPAEHAATLALHVEDSGSAVTLTLSGEIDLATSALLDAMLDDVLRRRREPALDELVVRTAGVEFLDAAGVSPLLHARAVLARRGGSVRFPDPSPAVARLLSLLGLSSLIPVLEQG